MISFVVPNLNEERYLYKFLYSLTWQINRNFEVILIDGGSTDNSLKICQHFKQKLDLKVIIDETRNIGYIRNLGVKHSTGNLIFNTSSDVMLDPHVTEEIQRQFNDPKLVALTARTKPVSDKILCHIAYQGFDLLRWAFTQLPNSLKKFRPGGNFLVVRRRVFDFVGGFPCVAINEDGLFGQRLDSFLLDLGCMYQVRFDLGLCVHHHVKRFEERGSVKTVLFYLYVFGNLFPMLKPLLYKVEAHSAEIFKNRSDLRDFKSEA